MRIALLVLISFCFVSSSFFAQSNSKTDARLVAEFKVKPTAYHDAYLVLEDQADLESMNADFKKRNVPVRERQLATLKALTEKANATQPAILAKLRNMPGINPESIKPLWIVNLIRISGTPAAIEQIAEMQEVNFVSKTIEAKPSSFEKIEMVNAAPPTPNGRERGLEVINAPALWKMGYTGYGTTVMIFDNGSDPEHPALRSNYKYHNEPQEEVWFGSDDLPFTCGAHGAHVAGTVLGLDRATNDTIGVAFNARYIHTANLNTCDERRSDFMEVYQWYFNPDGDPNTVDDIPHASNNSWGTDNPNVSFCSDPVVRSLIPAIIGLNVGTIFSAGNNGNEPRSLGSPAVMNADLVHLFAVGNLDVLTMEINPSSAIGPSICFSSDSSILIKPEVSAPGTNVRSSVLNGQYEEFTGTSMAAPHTVGAFLLLREAYPDVTEEDLLRSLYFTARDMGTPGEDNTYGMGLIDVLAAFNYLQDQGHVPVPPVSADNDVIAVYANYEKELFCKDEVSVEVIFENGGVDTLKTLDITLSETSGDIPPLLVKWTGNLAHDEIGTIDIPIEFGETGEYEILIELSKPNGMTDARDLNNNYKTLISYFHESEIEGNVASAFGSSACQNASVLLEATTPLDSNQTYLWYGTSSNPIGEGATFVTPPLNSSTIFSLDVASEYKVGKLAHDTPQFLFAAEGAGLIFDVKVPLTLKSVKIYASEAGGRQLTVIDSDGKNIGSKLFQVSAPGEHRIDLGIKIPAGSGYRIAQSLGKDLNSSRTNISFPYEIDNVISIKNSFTNRGNDGANYYNFYDWEVEALHACGRTEIPVTVSSATRASAVDFEVDSDTVLLAQAFEVFFTDASENAASWAWNFDNGMTSTEKDPIVSFDAPGTYQVTLTVTDDSGCVNSIMKEIFVIRDNMTSVENLDLPSKLKVFPNPANDVLYVNFPETFSNNATGTLTVTDLLGRTKISDHKLSGSDFQEIAVGDLAPGSYFLIFRAQSGRVAHAVFVKK